MTITTAAKELDDIRNNRIDPAETLIERTDTVGRWLATQKYSKLVGKLLTECHQLADRLRGGSGVSGNRIALS